MFRAHDLGDLAEHRRRAEAVQAIGDASKGGVRGQAGGVVGAAAFERQDQGVDAAPLARIAFETARQLRGHLRALRNRAGRAALALDRHDGRRLARRSRGLRQHLRRRPVRSRGPPPARRQRSDAGSTPPACRASAACRDRAGRTRPGAAAPPRPARLPRSAHTRPPSRPPSAQSGRDCGRRRARRIAGIPRSRVGALIQPVPFRQSTSGRHGRARSPRCGRARGRRPRCRRSPCRSGCRT